jgi:hypothetical protein
MSFLWLMGYHMFAQIAFLSEGYYIIYFHQALALAQYVF